MVKRVLFVCMGNICRSPAAEGVLRHEVRQRGLAEQISVESAGTIGYHAGELPDGRMRSAAAQRGYRLESRARQFVPADHGNYDLIIAMDESNLQAIEAQAPTGARDGVACLLSDFLPDRSPRDVPDPYYGGAAGFERVLDLLERAAPAIIAHLLDRPAS